MQNHLFITDDIHWNIFSFVAPGATDTKTSHTYFRLRCHFFLFFFIFCWLNGLRTPNRLHTKLHQNWISMAIYLRFSSIKSLCEHTFIFTHTEKNSFMSKFDNFSDKNEIAKRVRKRLNHLDKKMGELNWCVCIYQFSFYIQFYFQYLFFMSVDSSTFFHWTLNIEHFWFIYVVGIRHVSVDIAYIRGFVNHKKKITKIESESSKRAKKKSFFFRTDDR